MSLHLQKKGFDVTGVDYSQKSIDICKRIAKKYKLDDTTFLYRDATDTGLESSSFDVAYCTDIVEHLYPDIYIKLFEESRRLLKVGGKLIIYTPNPSHYLEILKNHNIILKKDITHVDYKKMKRLKKSLQNTGIIIKKSYYIESHLPIINIIEKYSMKIIPFLRRRNAILAIKQ